MKCATAIARSIDDGSIEVQEREPLEPRGPPSSWTRSIQRAVGDYPDAFQ